MLSAFRPLHTTRPCLLDLDPRKTNYGIEMAFEEPTFKFIFDGNEIDFKQEVRQELLKLMPRRPRSFADRADGFSEEAPAASTLKLLRLLCRRDFVSYAQVRSSPALLLALYETVATCSVPLAVSVADHFTFAGMVATHAPKAVQNLILNDIDSARQTGCIAVKELIADDSPPFNTEARYDSHERCFVLRGTGKFGIAGAEWADWALISATLTINKNENNGTHLLLVPLREGGVLRQGVSVLPIKAENQTLERAGVAVLHFDEVRIPVEYLLEPYTIRDNKLAYVEGQVGAPEVTEVLRTRMRLATGALFNGVMKRAVGSVVRYSAQKHVLGPSHERTFPYLGLQHVQTPLVTLTSNACAYIFLWQRVMKTFTDQTALKVPSYEDNMRLAGTVHVLQETLVEIEQFSQQFMGIHGSFRSTGMEDLNALVHLRQEGPDCSALIREVAYKSVNKNVGTSHWGWWLTNVLESVPSVNRFVSNPFYTPRVADLSRHLIFFGHKHYITKKRLRRSREIERRKGGSEHQWYDWTTFRHREVVHCGEAFVEMLVMETIIELIQQCQDPRGRKIIRDVGWIYALARQMARLDFIISHKMLSAGKSLVLASHLDNIITVMAPQCVNLVDSMMVPEAFRSPCAADDIEPYWTIPGTNTNIQRGDKVTIHQEKEYGGTKDEQETIRESDEEVDLFHGLADKPSFAKKK